MKELEELVKTLEGYMNDAKWFLDNNWEDERDRQTSGNYPAAKARYTAYRYCYLEARRTLDKALGVVKPGD